MSNLLVPPVKREPSAKSKLATCDDVELSSVNVRVPAPVISNVVLPPVNPTLVSAIVRSSNVFDPVNVCDPSRNAKVPFVPRSGKV